MRKPAWLWACSPSRIAVISAITLVSKKPDKPDKTGNRNPLTSQVSLSIVRPLSNYKMI
jgi:hypothetical protein